MQLFLIRHPAPRIAPGTCYGRSDLELRESPAALAAEVATLLPAATCLFSSPLQRCRELALAISAEAVIDERLVEMDFGEWELRAWNEINRDGIDRWAAAPFDFAPPGGESAMAMATRVIAFAREQLAPRGRSIAVVSHHGPLRVLAAIMLGQPRESWLSLSFEQGTVSLVEVGDHGAAFRYRNHRPIAQHR
ncbi:MAG TPA: alpha-ribazole phosphatase family protein [Rhodocyclaceae bacterium]